jgi:hypothetical protein
MERSERQRWALLFLVFLYASVCLGQTYAPGDPPLGAFLYPYEGNVYLAGSRVSFVVQLAGDLDICYPDCCNWYYVSDDLAPDTPCWEATDGSFPFGNTGPWVTWQAPDNEVSAIDVMFYVDDLPWYADDIVTTPTQVATVSTIVPYVDSVSFRDNDALNPNEHDIYPIYDPVWTYQGKNEPASYTKNTYERVVGEFGHPDVLTQAEWINVVPLGGNDYWEAEGVRIAPGTYGGTYAQSGNVSIGRLPDHIGIETRTLNWQYKVPNGSFNWILMQDNPTGPHTLYTVFGPPTCPYPWLTYTKSNLAEAVAKGSGGTTEPNIASKVNDKVDPNAYEGCICESPFQVNFDAAMGRHPPSGPWGMCCCRAEGLKCVLEVLGIGPYIHDYVNERAEPNPGGLLPPAQHCDICGQWCARAYWDGGWNQWEGVVKARPEIGSMCYAPAHGRILIDEGTYTAIRNAIATDPALGFKWAWGDKQFQICTHMAPP